MVGREMLLLADGVHRSFSAAAVATASSPDDAVLVRGGRVVAVGPAARLRAQAGSGASVLDLRGAVITPGLADAHIHLLEWAQTRREVDLRGAADPRVAAARVAGQVVGGTVDGWVRGRGWHIREWGGEYPTRELLDAVLPERPVALQSYDMHALWVNGAALRSAGITAATPDPAGGRIVRGPDGEPTGVLLEKAAELLVRCIPPISAAEARAAVLDAQAELHGLGITAVHSFPSLHLPGPAAFSTLEELRTGNELRLRVLQHLPLEQLDEARTLGLRSGFGGDWVRIGNIKIFLDGTLGSQTAWLLEPYTSSADRGIQVLAEADFRDAVLAAASGGLAVAVHAIGDAAVGLALDVLSEPGLRVGAMPHRIEHLQLCPPGRVGAVAEAGISCSVQPAHLMTDWPLAEKHWGEQRCRRAYALRSLAGGAGAGASPLAFGSDAPVEPVDPRLGLFAATMRQDLAERPVCDWFAEERIDVGAAMCAYTLGAARAAGAVGQLGELEPGALADLVAWDRDPLAARGAALLSLRCVATVVNGEVVAGEAAAAMEG